MTEVLKEISLRVVSNSDTCFSGVKKDLQLQDSTGYPTWFGQYKRDKELLEGRRQAGKTSACVSKESVRESILYCFINFKSLSLPIVGPSDGSEIGLVPL